MRTLAIDVALCYPIARPLFNGGPSRFHVTRDHVTPDASRIRQQTVEHPFGTMKARMGSTHFLTRTLPRVRTEMSLHVLAYNMKRALQIFGTQTLIAFIRA
jgi:transposase